MSALRKRPASQPRCGALALTWAMLTGCSARQPAPPLPREPASVLELMPRDLDFAVRLDASLLAQKALTSAMISELTDDAAPTILRETLEAYGDARAVAFGGRWMSDGLHGDGVVAVERGADADSQAWPAPGQPFRERFLRAGVRVFERVSPSRRDEAALEVVVKNGVVLATDAEVDAVLRVLENGPDSDRIEPPARGLLSLVLRVQGGPQPTLPFVRDLMRGLLRVEGTLTLLAAPASGVLAETELAYRSSTEAAAAVQTCVETTEALQRARDVDERWHAAARSAHAVQAGSGLRLTFQLPFARRPVVH